MSALRNMASRAHTGKRTDDEGIQSKLAPLPLGSRSSPVAFHLRHFTPKAKNSQNDLAGLHSG